ncbi:TCR VDJ BV7 BJ7 [Pelobates cultripes]|nr:TCR VDJ BV7 BJ7 [Pelobates cultripes]
MGGMWTLFSLHIALIIFPCLCLGVKVEQGSKLIIVSIGKPVELQCEHDDSSLWRMYWYQQRPGQELKLMVLSTAANSDSETMEEGFKSWVWNRPTILNSTLKLSSSQTADSAVYFCAVSDHSHRSLSNTEHKTMQLHSAPLSGTAPG